MYVYVVRYDTCHTLLPPCRVRQFVGHFPPLRLLLLLGTGSQRTRPPRPRADICRARRVRSLGCYVRVFVLVLDGRVRDMLEERDGSISTGLIWILYGVETRLYNLEREEKRKKKKKKFYSSIKCCCCHRCGEGVCVPLTLVPFLLSFRLFALPPFFISPAFRLARAF